MFFNIAIIVDILINATPHRSCMKLIKCQLWNQSPTSFYYRLIDLSSLCFLCSSMTTTTGYLWVVDKRFEDAILGVEKHWLPFAYIFWYLTNRWIKKMIDNAKVVMAIFCLCFQPDKVKKKKKRWTWLVFKSNCNLKCETSVATLEQVQFKKK